jgi:hypothetical protein
MRAGVRRFAKEKNLLAKPSAPEIEEIKFHSLHPSVARFRRAMIGSSGTNISIGLLLNEISPHTGISQFTGLGHEGSAKADAAKGTKDIDLVRGCNACS